MPVPVWTWHIDRVLINTAFAGLPEISSDCGRAEHRGILLTKREVFRENEPLQVTLVTLLANFVQYTTNEAFLRNEIDQQQCKNQVSFEPGCYGRTRLDRAVL